MSIDSEEIAEVAKRYGCEVPFMRPAELASDLATDKVVFEHALDLLQAEQNLTPELFVQVRPTTPLRSPNLIDAAVGKIRFNPNFTGLRSVYEMSETAWKGFETDHTGALVSLLDKVDYEVRDGADALDKCFHLHTLLRGLWIWFTRVYQYTVACMVVESMDL